LRQIAGAAVLVIPSFVSTESRPRASFAGTPARSQRRSARLRFSAPGAAELVESTSRRAAARTRDRVIPPTDLRRPRVRRRSAARPCIRRRTRQQLFERSFLLLQGSSIVYRDDDTEEAAQLGHPWALSTKFQKM